MTYFVSLTIIGICVGMVYALVAMGLVLLLRAVNVMNFAQGNLLALGAYAAFFVFYRMDFSGIPAILLLFIAFILFGAIFMLATYWPLRNSKWEAASMLCTMGAGTAIAEMCTLVVGSRQYAFAPILDGTVTVLGYSLSYQYIFIFAFCLLTMAAIYVLFDKMYVGRCMSAAAQNPFAAQLMGIPTFWTTMFTYIIVMLSVGFGGYMIAPIYFVRSTLSTFQAKAFAALVIGGYGNLKGAVIGGLLVGLIESYSSYLTTTYKDVIVFGFLMLVLIFKPDGLFKGIRYTEKA